VDEAGADGCCFFVVYIPSTNADLDVIAVEMVVYVCRIACVCSVLVIGKCPVGVCGFVLRWCDWNFVATYPGIKPECFVARHD
jgi:hypothetical protein